MTRPKSPDRGTRKPRQAHRPAKVAEAAVAPVPAVSLPEAAITAMPAAVFKARCLELMDRVQAEGGEIVITKYGRPVAKLVPASPDAPRGFGALRGSIVSYGDLVSPVDERWEAQLG